MMIIKLFSLKTIQLTKISQINTFGKKYLASNNQILPVMLGIELKLLWQSWILAAITPVFSITWFFRNYSNMPIYIYVPMQRYQILNWPFAKTRPPLSLLPCPTSHGALIPHHVFDQWKIHRGAKRNLTNNWQTSLSFQNCHFLKKNSNNKYSFVAL